MNWAEFFSMDGRGFYVWGSFGAFLLCIIVEIVLVRLRIGRAQEDVRMARLADSVEANHGAAK
jgi:heme exporter protein CcmD